MKYTLYTNQLFLTFLLFLFGLIPSTNVMAQNEAMYAPNWRKDVGLVSELAILVPN